MKLKNRVKNDTDFKMNITRFGTQVIGVAFKKKIVRNECREPSQKVEHVVKEWFGNYLVVLDGGIDKAVEAAMKIKHLAKCNIQKSLYNFTDKDVSQNLLEQIENGIKNVPTIKKDGISVIKNSLGEILHNLKMFRKIKHRRPPINQWEVRNWLKIAIDDVGDGTEGEYIAYYRYVRNNLGKAMKIIKWNCDESHCDLKTEDINDAIEIPGVIFVLADKNYGITLLPIESVVEAEKNMLEELKAHKIRYNSCEITQFVETKIRLFEKSLPLVARQYVDGMEINRFLRPREIKLPFLKLNAKIHKMNLNVILTKNTLNIKFRPVQDSK